VQVVFGGKGAGMADGFVPEDEEANAGGKSLIEMERGGTKGEMVGVPH